MRKLLILFVILILTTYAKAVTHTVHVWDGYFQFTPSNITVDLGDTIQWLPYVGGAPIMVHSITSTTIPTGAVVFDYTWQAPADTFFQYVPTIAGNYDYECTPHAVSYNMIGTIIVTGTTNTTSVFENAPMLAIYPNPAHHSIRLYGSNDKYDYNIYNLNGQLVDTGKFIDELDISHLDNGIYIIELIAQKPRSFRIQKL
jgi:plastocyanin